MLCFALSLQNEKNENLEESALNYKKKHTVVEVVCFFDQNFCSNSGKTSKIVQYVQDPSTFINFSDQIQMLAYFFKIL